MLEQLQTSTMVGLLVRSLMDQTCENCEKQQRGNLKMEDEDTVLQQNQVITAGLLILKRHIRRYHELLKYLLFKASASLNIQLSRIKEKLEHIISYDTSHKMAKDHMRHNVPSARASNFFSMPPISSALIFSNLTASFCASRIHDGRSKPMVITKALTRKDLILSFRLKTSATTFAFPG
ncbi:hypothetical protein Tco_0216465 [Tanacetum coccineum]